MIVQTILLKIRLCACTAVCIGLRPVLRFPWVIHVWLLLAPPLSTVLLLNTDYIYITIRVPSSNPGGTIMIALIMTGYIKGLAIQ